MSIFYPGDGFQFQRRVQFCGVASDHIFFFFAFFVGQIGAGVISQFGFEGWILNLIVSVHCLSFYLFRYEAQL